MRNGPIVVPYFLRGPSREYRARFSVFSQYCRFIRVRWPYGMNNLRGISEAERFDSPRLHHKIPAFSAGF